MGTTVDVIIPVYRPDKRFQELLRRLNCQTKRPDRIILMNTEETHWKPDVIRGLSGVEVHHVPKAEFDHGGTRARAAELSDADLMVFMTQDALPADRRLIEKLIEPLSCEQIWVSYARQCPASSSQLAERYSRHFNYPDTSSVKSQGDLPRLGIKTYFCSNVCAAYRKDVYRQLGGFETKAIFNEDMIYAAHVISAGGQIAYVAEARVIHSHNYSNLQQFQRNFDLGVSQAKHPEIFAKVPSEGEGIALVQKTAGYLLSRHRPWLLPSLVLQSAAKYSGYLLGKNYRKLPKQLLLACSNNKDYWRI